MMDYKVICKPAGSGMFDYYVPGRSPGKLVQGRSTSPLFDACRKLKRMGEPAMARAALFHDGSDVWSVRCLIWAGAELMVSHARFVKYHA
jgi:hypothetical protein